MATVCVVMMLPVVSVLDVAGFLPKQCAALAFLLNYACKISSVQQPRFSDDAGFGYTCWTRIVSSAWKCDTLLSK